MPKKRMSEAKSDSAAGKPEPKASSVTTQARKAPLRSAPMVNGAPVVGGSVAAAGAVDGAGAAPKNPALPRGVAARSKKATRPRPAASKKNLSAADREADSFREAVARLAYHFYEARAAQQSSPDQDWLRAEQALREVLEKLSSASA
jgi:hypothetical protein